MSMTREEHRRLAIGHLTWMRDEAQAAFRERKTISDGAHAEALDFALRAIAEAEAGRKLAEELRLSWSQHPMAVTAALATYDAAIAPRSKPCVPLCDRVLDNTGIAPVRCQRELGHEGEHHA